MQQVPGMGAYQVPQQPAMNGPVPVQQQPQFAQPAAYTMGGMMQPQQPQAMMGNPIGYVDPNAAQQDFTQQQQQPVQQQAATQPAAPMPEPPKNPNVKDKATVSKNFAG